MAAPTPTHSDNPPEQSSWLDRSFLSGIPLTWETLLFVLIILAAIVTRFYDLEARVMSHDETSHVYYSWRLSEGMGYEHTPLTHGPFQFHVVALAYYLFGDNDLTARIPAVLTNILTIFMVWHYRRWLGKAGALVTGVLMVISPYFLYYARYVRNEAFVGLAVMISLWAILRYLETGKEKYFIYLTLGTVLHVTSKETSFIYAAQALLFLGLLFVARITQQKWPKPQYRNGFLGSLAVGFVLVGVTAMAYFQHEKDIEAALAAGLPEPGNALTISMAVLTLLFFLAATALMLIGYTQERLRQERTADLAILLGTLTLPMLTPFLIVLAHFDPQDYSSAGMTRTLLFLVPVGLVTAGIGIWWRPRAWLINNGIFYAIFTVLYTTLFTNGNGFFTGLIGSLGYWLAQQEVQRGSQPWYYYVGLQIPVYEFLPALASLLALGFGLRAWLRKAKTNQEAEVVFDPDGTQPAPAILFFGYWIITAIVAYTYAGEKMPWLTFHITQPMILVGGWALGQLIERMDWAHFREQKGWQTLLLVILFFIALVGTFGALLGATPPFQGSTLQQLNATSTFITALVVAVLSGVGLFRHIDRWSLRQVVNLGLLVVFAFLGIITARSAFRAAYINYDYPTEYLVYAHTGSGIKVIQEQLEEISLRTTDGLEMLVAFDNETTYPYWWYLRNFPNQRYYGETPTRDLRDAPVIMVGDNNYGKIEPVVAQGYDQFDFIRMWWPNQDYYNLTWERIWNVVSNQEWRSAVFDIWYHRDYTRYAELTGADFSLSNWNPSDRMRLYIRKDVVSMLWNYGSSAAPETTEPFMDPYEGKQVALQPISTWGIQGSAPGQFNAPRGLAVAPDGSVYVADSRNHRIQHLDENGNVLQSWGTFADILRGEAPPGTFNEPWDVAIGPDGSIYVADTWNHRIQKFTAEGQFVTMWGYFGQAETGEAFWGPRSVVVSPDNRVFVSDTGNKRIAIFDANGGFLGQFGSAGMAAGMFDEPVGIALGPGDTLFVADTWNQRIQVFVPEASAVNSYIPLNRWDIVGWYGQSLDNKPYIAADGIGRLFITDPEGFRVLQFTQSGQIVNYWGDYSPGPDGFGLASGIETGPDGSVWVSDGANHRIFRFDAPGNP